MHVEYCLRNAPELTEELVQAHAIYSQASGWAAQLLSQQYPEPVGTRTIAVADGKDPRTQAIQLRMIQSQGPARCPALVREMQTSTGQSLAKELSREYQGMLNTIRQAQ